MSLKAFHILFITASVLLSFWFGWFELSAYSDSKAAMNLWLGIGSCVAGVALVAYGIYFLKKLKNISYL
ncbi:MAG: hypothetical protein FJ392_05510 [Verrucomicrobia bacterium]|nr:hypothetical protein [Verrucomicrobiota bacterium]